MTGRKKAPQFPGPMNDSKFFDIKKRPPQRDGLSKKFPESVLLLLQLIFWYHQEVYNGVSR